MKKYITIFSLLILAVFIMSNSGCGEPSADMQLQQQTESHMQEANMQVGYPAIINFQEKKLVKMIMELRDQEDLICHAYLVNTMNGTVGQYLGKCIGYGLPYATQFSNPEKRNLIHAYNLPQPEPNGLFMPDGLSATWLLLLDEKGDPHPTYIEPEIIVSPFKL